MEHETSERRQMQPCEGCRKSGIRAREPPETRV
jgi:hypothetical protein